MMTIADPIPSQFWRCISSRRTGVVHAFAPSGLTCCGHFRIRECVATIEEPRCEACVAAIERLKRALAPCEAAE